MWFAKGPIPETIRMRAAKPPQEDIKMKSIQQKLAEAIMALKEKNPARLERVMAETKVDGAGDDRGMEKRLAFLEKALQESGGRIRKNNGANWRALSESELFTESCGGGGVAPSPSDPRVKQTMKEMRMNYRESCVFLGHGDPRPGRGEADRGAARRALRVVQPKGRLDRGRDHEAGRARSRAPGRCGHDGNSAV